MTNHPLYYKVNKTEEYDNLCIRKNHLINRIGDAPNPNISLLELNDSIDDQCGICFKNEEKRTNFMKVAQCNPNMKSEEILRRYIAVLEEQEQILVDGKYIKNDLEDKVDNGN